jgi:transcriptional regulator with XRE-family HTH domain
MTIEESVMRRQTNFNRYPEKKVKDPGFAERFKKNGDARDVAIQIASLRKASGMSQKELAKEVGTSQQQISRLESPSYEGHSLSMLRRVVKVLGGTIHVRIQPGKQLTRSAFNRDLRKQTDLQRFELDFLRKEKVDLARNFRILDGLYNEALALGVIPLRKPLDGIEIDLKIAKAVNRV